MSFHPVTLDQVKTHLRISGDEEDTYLTLLASAALRAIENHTCRSIGVLWPEIHQDDRVVVGQAMLLLIGHWYENRESTAGGQLAEMPMALTWLLAPLRKWGP